MCPKISFRNYICIAMCEIYCPRLIVEAANIFKQQQYMSTFLRQIQHLLPIKHKGFMGSIYPMKWLSWVKMYVNCSRKVCKTFSIRCENGMKNSWYFIYKLSFQEFFMSISFKVNPWRSFHGLEPMNLLCFMGLEVGNFHDNFVG